MQLRQYELIKSIILKLLEKEYPHISYILGGFKSLHDFCIKYNIPIVKHKQNNCYICTNKSLEENDTNKMNEKESIRKDDLRNNFETMTIDSFKKLFNELNSGSYQLPAKLPKLKEKI